MSGYIGTKAVLLSTTAATVTGDMTVGGAATISGAFTSKGIDDNAAATAMTLDASGKVGIGTAAPSAKLTVDGDALVKSGNKLTLNRADNAIGGAMSYVAGTGFIFNDANGDGTSFNVGATNRMRIDSSGNLLVGKTSDSFSTVGSSYRANGSISATASSNEVLDLNRLGTDGGIMRFFKDGTTVGSIGVAANGTEIYLAGSGANTSGIFCSNGNSLLPMKAGTLSDGTQDLGSLSRRFDDIFAANGTIQTSDRNEKQDIDVLNAAETAVAQACKGLLRKFRWKDAVAEKGDDARIHFGIIAQDLQDAFTAQGLDAGRYAMFISSTWWEADRIIPAVEAVAAQDAVYEDVIIPAVLDEEGNEIEAERVEQQLVSEAIEAVEAVAEQTVTDTFETLEEAPEGATERTRLGVRYPELLAFILGAM